MNAIHHFIPYFIEVIYLANWLLFSNLVAFCRRKANSKCDSSYPIDTLYLKSSKRNYSQHKNKTEQKVTPDGPVEEPHEMRGGFSVF